MNRLAPQIRTQITLQRSYLPLCEIELNIPPWAPKFPVKQFHKVCDSIRHLYIHLVSLSKALKRMKEDKSSFIFPDDADHMREMKSEVVHALDSVFNALGSGRLLHRHELLQLHIRILEMQSKFKKWIDSFIERNRETMHLHLRHSSHYKPTSSNHIDMEANHFVLADNVSKSKSPPSVSPSASHLISIDEMDDSDKLPNIHGVKLPNNYHVMSMNAFVFSLNHFMSELIALCQHTRFVLSLENPKYQQGF